MASTGDVEGGEATQKPPPTSDRTTALAKYRPFVFVLCTATEHYVDLSRLVEAMTKDAALANGKLVLLGEKILASDGSGLGTGAAHQPASSSAARAEGPRRESRSLVAGSTMLTPALAKQLYEEFVAVAELREANQLAAQQKKRTLHAARVEQLMEDGLTAAEAQRAALEAELESGEVTSESDEEAEGKLPKGYGMLRGKLAGAASGSDSDSDASLGVLSAISCSSSLSGLGCTKVSDADAHSEVVPSDPKEAMRQLKLQRSSRRLNAGEHLFVCLKSNSMSSDQLLEILDAGIPVHAIVTVNSAAAIGQATALQPLSAQQQPSPPSKGGRSKRQDSAQRNREGNPGGGVSPSLPKSTKGGAPPPPPPIPLADQVRAALRQRLPSAPHPFRSIVCIDYNVATREATDTWRASGADGSGGGNLAAPHLVAMERERDVFMNVIASIRSVEHQWRQFTSWERQRLVAAVPPYVPIHVLTSVAKNGGGEPLSTEQGDLGDGGESESASPGGGVKKEKKVSKPGKVAQGKLPGGKPNQSPSAQQRGKDTTGCGDSCSAVEDTSMGSDVAVFAAPVPSSMREVTVRAETYVKHMQSARLLPQVASIHSTSPQTTDTFSALTASQILMACLAQVDTSVRPEREPKAAGLDLSTAVLFSPPQVARSALVDDSLQRDITAVEQYMDSLLGSLSGSRGEPLRGPETQCSQVPEEPSSCRPSKQSALAQLEALVRHIEVYGERNAKSKSSRLGKWVDRPIGMQHPGHTTGATDDDNNILQLVAEAISDFTSIESKNGMWNVAPVTRSEEHGGSTSSSMSVIALHTLSSFRQRLRRLFLQTSAMHGCWKAYIRHNESFPNQALLFLSRGGARAVHGGRTSSSLYVFRGETSFPEFLAQRQFLQRELAYYRPPLNEDETEPSDPTSDEEDDTEDYDDDEDDHEEESSDVGSDPDSEIRRAPRARRTRPQKHYDVVYCDVAGEEQEAKRRRRNLVHVRQNLLKHKASASHAAGSKTSGGGAVPLQVLRTHGYGAFGAMDEAEMFFIPQDDCAVVIERITGNTHQVHTTVLGSNGISVGFRATLPQPLALSAERPLATTAMADNSNPPQQQPAPLSPRTGAGAAADPGKVTDPQHLHTAPGALPRAPPSASADKTSNCTKVGDYPRVSSGTHTVIDVVGRLLCVMDVAAEDSGAAAEAVYRLAVEEMRSLARQQRESQTHAKDSKRFRAKGKSIGGTAEETEEALIALVPRPKPPVYQLPHGSFSAHFKERGIVAQFFPQPNTTRRPITVVQLLRQQSAQCRRPLRFGVLNPHINAVEEWTMTMIHGVTAYSDGSVRLTGYYRRHDDYGLVVGSRSLGHDTSAGNDSGGAEPNTVSSVNADGSTLLTQQQQQGGCDTSLSIAVHGGLSSPFAVRGGEGSGVPKQSCGMPAGDHPQVLLAPTGDYVTEWHGAVLLTRASGERVVCQLPAPQSICDAEHRDPEWLVPGPNGKAISPLTVTNSSFDSTGRRTVFSREDGMQRFVRAVDEATPSGAAAEEVVLADGSTLHLFMSGDNPATREPEDSARSGEALGGESPHPSPKALRGIVRWEFRSFPVVEVDRSTGRISVVDGSAEVSASGSEVHVVDESVGFAATFDMSNNLLHAFPTRTSPRYLVDVAFGGLRVDDSKVHVHVTPFGRARQATIEEEYRPDPTDFTKRQTVNRFVAVPEVLCGRFNTIFNAAGGCFDKRAIHLQRAEHLPRCPRPAAVSMFAFPPRATTARNPAEARLSECSTTSTPASVAHFTAMQLLKKAVVQPYGPADVHDPANSSRSASPKAFLLAPPAVGVADARRIVAFEFLSPEEVELIHERMERLGERGRNCQAHAIRSLKRTGCHEADTKTAATPPSTTTATGGPEVPHVLHIPVGIDGNEVAGQPELLPVATSVAIPRSLRDFLCERNALPGTRTTTECGSIPVPPNTTDARKSHPLLLCVDSAAGISLNGLVHTVVEEVLRGPMTSNVSAAGYAPPSEQPITEERVSSAPHGAQPHEGHGDAVTAMAPLTLQSQSHDAPSPSPMRAPVLGNAALETPEAQRVQPDGSACGPMYNYWKMVPGVVIPRAHWDAEVLAARPPEPPKNPPPENGAAKPSMPTERTQEGPAYLADLKSSSAAVAAPEEQHAKASRGPPPLLLSRAKPHDVTGNVLQPTLSPSAGASKAALRSQSDAVASRSMQALASLRYVSGELRVDPGNVELGVVNIGERYTAVLTVTNVSSVPCRYRVRVSHRARHCMWVTYPHHFIAPGLSFTVVIDMIATELGRSSADSASDPAVVHLLPGKKSTEHASDMEDDHIATASVTITFERGTVVIPVKWLMDRRSTKVEHAAISAQSEVAE